MNNFEYFLHFGLVFNSPTYQAILRIFNLLSPPLFNKERGKEGVSFLIKIIISKLLNNNSNKSIFYRTI